MRFCFETYYTMLLLFIGALVTFIYFDNALPSIGILSLNVCLLFYLVTQVWKTEGRIS